MNISVCIYIQFISPLVVFTYTFAFITHRKTYTERARERELYFDNSHKENMVSVTIMQCSNIVGYIHMYTQSYMYGFIIVIFSIFFSLSLGKVEVGV